MLTTRLELRRFTPDDWGDLYDYLSQAAVVAFEPYEVFDIETAKQEAIKRSCDNAFWAVCLKSTGKVIGNVYLKQQDFDTWELGYVFNAHFQGNGYAAEAAGTLVDSVFRDFAAHRVYAQCNPLNVKSWQLLERLGFRREGHLIQNVWFKKDSAGQPIWCDTYVYAKLAKPSGG
jgi:RimJ/RimL family protein N-acetyltransferase